MYRLFLRRCSPEVVLSRAERRRSKSHSGATWPSPPCWSQSPAGLVKDSTNSLNHIATLRCSDHVRLTHLLHDLLYDLYYFVFMFLHLLNGDQHDSTKIDQNFTSCLWHLVTSCDILWPLRWAKEWLYTGHAPRELSAEHLTEADRQPETCHRLTMLCHALPLGSYAESDQVTACLCRQEFYCQLIVQLIVH